MQVLLATLADFGTGSMLARRAQNTDVLLIRADDGSISALEDRCSHADFKLSEGTYEGGEVTCPAHGARFDCKTGAARCMPAFTPVRTFPVELRGDAIYVTL